MVLVRYLHNKRKLISNYLKIRYNYTTVYRNERKSFVFFYKISCPSLFSFQCQFYRERDRKMLLLVSLLFTLFNSPIFRVNYFNFHSFNFKS